MERWIWISLILCAVGLFKEFRPSEPFVTEYLIEYKNFTKSTVVHTAYPIATYTYLGTLPIVFLVTDFLRYKSVIILEGIAFVLTYTLLIWGDGLTNLKIVEVLYGLACSTEVAYYTYIYAKVDRDQYKKVTSYTYTAIFVGNCGAAILSQLLVSSKLMNYHQLNYLTLGSVSISLFISFILPGVGKSIYFYRNINQEEIAPAIVPGEDDKERDRGDITPETLTYSQRIRRAYKMLWYDFKRAYSNPHVVKWSVWWAIASAGHVQVVNYVQALYETIYPSKEGEIYNAGVDAIHTTLSAIMAICVGHVTLPWSKWGELLLLLISIVQGTALVWMGQTSSIFAAYGCYIIFRTFYQVMITVASSEVAQGISADSYGLIFGFNRFVSLVLQSTITFVVTDERGLALNERTQFSIYGAYFYVVGGIFGVACISSYWRKAALQDSELPEEVRNRLSSTEEQEDNIVA